MRGPGKQWHCYDGAIRGLWLNPIALCVNVSQDVHIFTRDMQWERDTKCELIHRAPGAMCISIYGYGLRYLEKSNK